MPPASMADIYSAKLGGDGLSRRRGIRVCCGAGASGAVSNNKQREVVRLACSAREVLHGLEHAFLKLIERTLRLSRKHFAKPWNAEKLFVGVHSFGHTIAEKDNGVPRFKFQASRCVLGFRNEPYGIRTLAEWFLSHAMPNQKG